VSARTTDLIISVARRAFVHGYVKGLAGSRLADARLDAIQAEDEFKKWWNAAAGFEEVL
jgi:hypothetical protein